MNRKNIQIVVDFSMSMRNTIGLVYVFLHEFLHYSQENSDLLLTYQLIWFTGDTWKLINFENGKNYTDHLEQMLAGLKRLYLRNGTKSNEATIEEAVTGALKNAHGDATEQALFLFTDYHAKRLLDLTDAGGIRKVFLFVPQGQGMNYRFRIINKSNITQKIMPILMWSMESLKQEMTAEDKECMLRYLAM